MEKEQVVISVIIPVYNGEMYICDICKSLEEQTYKNYEVIFVDDGSTDGSYQTLNQLKKDHYTIIHQENRGVSAARNTGIHIAKGQYIAFIDVDDTIHPEYLHFLQNQKYLFVRKNKDDGEAKEFYFLGEINAVGEPHPIVMEQTKYDAFEITYLLDHPIREDIYEYIVGE